MKYLKTYFFLIFFFNYNIFSQNINEKVVFTSSSPYTFEEIISKSKNPKQIVYGKLVIPYDSLNPNKKFPLVIGVAGSEGWRDHHYDYLKMYQKSGFATFELNSFKSRNIESTVGTQNEVTVAAIVVDAYNALETLSKHPLIIKEKISITGWSLGGGVTLFSAWNPIKETLGNNVQFASHLAFYPPCFFDFENLDFSDVPIHILIGEIDDWTPAKPCEEFVDKLDRKNINITVYKDSHHGFDREGELEFNENGYSFKNCMFEVNSKGDILMNYLNIPMSNPFLQKLGFLFCIDRGVTIGGNKDARLKSFEFANEFMIRTLKN
ncbi:MAG: dienelactone hydrolase family protein [Flavobacteriaceae bacterium]|nr:dienelactone hydrolase family protein [Flavobacteriaceae bacterium]